MDLTPGSETEFTLQDTNTSEVSEDQPSSIPIESVLADLYTEANDIEHKVAKLAPEIGDRAELTITAYNDGLGHSYSATVILPDGKIVHLK